MCTGYCHKPSFVHSNRRRRNIGVRWSIGIRQLHAQYPKFTILLTWCPGDKNCADLVSQSHEDMATVLNSNLWRNGSEMFKEADYPGSNVVIYGYLKNEEFQWSGFPNGTF